MAGLSRSQSHVRKFLTAIKELVGATARALKSGTTSWDGKYKSC